MVRSTLIGSLVVASCLIASCKDDARDLYLVVRGSPAAADADFLYYFQNDTRESQQLSSYRKSTGEQKALSAFPAGREIAVGDGFVFSTETGTVRVPISGGAPEPVRNEPCIKMVVSDGTLFCLAPAPPSIPDEMYVLIALPISGGPERIVVPATPTTYVIDAGTVFWAALDGRVSKTDIASGANQVLATGDAVRAIAVDDKNVYFVNLDTHSGSTQEIRRVARDGSAASVVTAIVGAVSIAVDDRFVYWLDNGLQAIPKDGGNPFVVAYVSGSIGLQGPPSSILIDSSNVYWWDDVIRRVPRPR